MRSAASDFAVELLDELIGQGVQDIVVCPGSRSQALALAAAHAEKAGAVRLHVRVDERSAAFFALGIGRESRRPAAVIVTSGTAVANLLPATQEAHYARVPLILLTADRPSNMRGTRANQTVSDTSFTGEFVRLRLEAEALEGDAEVADPREIARRAYAKAGGKVPAVAGPVHINVAFEDPLSAPIDGWAPRNDARGEKLGNDGYELRDLPEYVHDNSAPNTIVIAGADAGPDAENFAHEAGVPLLAEPSSGARFGREAIQHWEELLKSAELQSEIGCIVVFGHPTLTRVVPQVLQNENIDTVIVDGATGSGAGLELYNPGGMQRTFVAAARVADGFDLRARRPWLGAWVVADRELRAAHTTVHAPDLEKALATGYKERSDYAREEVARLRLPVTREHLTETTWLATWPHDRLVVASSRLVRVLNRQAAPRGIKVHANRGLAGIDGTIATALGVAVASQTVADAKAAAGVTRLLIGDLAFLHDAGSLALTAGETRPRIQIVVGNDGGGTIFEKLEVFQTADAEAFKRVMLTPQEVSIASLAAAYGWEHRLVENQGDLERAFTVPVTGPEILEVALG